MNKGKDVGSVMEYANVSNLECGVGRGEAGEVGGDLIFKALEDHVKEISA